MFAARASRPEEAAPEADAAEWDAAHVELASGVFDLLHELGTSENPIARATAEFLSQASGYFEFIGAHANAQGEHFARDVRLARRNKLLRELGGNASRLAAELGKHAGSRKISGRLEYQSISGIRSPAPIA